ncbi:unnamed protein product [Calypogeia fissa]
MSDSDSESVTSPPLRSGETDPDSSPAVRTIRTTSATSVATDKSVLKDSPSTSETTTPSTPPAERENDESKALVVVPNAAHRSEPLSETKALVPVSDADVTKSPPRTPPKTAWGDEDEDDPVESLPMNNLKVSPDDEAEKPDFSLKALILNEEVESPETEIRKVLVDNNTPYTSAKRFEDLNLSDNLLRGLYSEMKFEKPSRIQAETLPLILRPPYENLIAQAHNGSGKTTCFVLGMLSRVNPAIKAPQALCVCPTRELAIQNEEVLLKMGKYTGITSASTAAADTTGVFSSRREQIVEQVVIGTPGTLKRWMTRDKILATKNINVLVFDEADHMFDQDGFQDDSLRIMNNIKASRGSGCQVLLFSATFSEKVKNFTLRAIPKANKIFVPKEELSLDVIKQYRVRCPNVNCKIIVLKDKIFPAAEKLGQSIIFVRTRQSASELHRILEVDGFKCTSIQGGLTHAERDRVIKEFRSGETKILIATDVLARGFDQAQVTLVVNYDIPTKLSNPYEPDYELYLHRIGRSGRFGRKGAAFNLTGSDSDEVLVDLISKHFNKYIQEVPWDDDYAFEAVLKDAGLA